MAEKKQDTGFTVTDRRLFTSDGDLRSDVPEEMQSEPVKPSTPPPASATSEAAPHAAASNVPDSQVPAPPTAAEQKASDDAYRVSAKDLDARVELSGHSAKELEMTFERFMASLYMSAMMQMGMMHEEGAQPRIDLIGARQAIDTLGLLQTKTKGNLTPAESNFLQEFLLEFCMEYVGGTDALARPPQAPSPAAGGKTR